MQRPTLSVRVSPDLLTKLDQIAARRGESRSDAAERALRIGLDDLERTDDLFASPVFRATVGRLLGSEAVLKGLYVLAGEDVKADEVKQLAGRVRRAADAGKRRGRS